MSPALAPRCCCRASFLPQATLAYWAKKAIGSRSACSSVGNMLGVSSNEARKQLQVTAGPPTPSRGLGASLSCVEEVSWVFGALKATCVQRALQFFF